MSIKLHFDAYCTVNLQVVWKQFPKYVFRHWNSDWRSKWSFNCHWIVPGDHSGDDVSMRIKSENDVILLLLYFRVDVRLLSPEEEQLFSHVSTMFWGFLWTRWPCRWPVPGCTQRRGSPSPSPAWPRSRSTAPARRCSGRPPNSLATRAQTKLCTVSPPNSITAGVVVAKLQLLT